jgi:hypothetical protein
MQRPPAGQQVIEEGKHRWHVHFCQAGGHAQALSGLPAGVQLCHL